jgi:hypothetical protein
LPAHAARGGVGAAAVGPPLPPWVLLLQGRHPLGLLFLQVGGTENFENQLCQNKSIEGK